jgi:sulfite reductase (NADPH) flavoprotein alpha-component
MSAQLIPESAPFSAEQRAWLNGFLNGMLGIADSSTSSSPGAARDGVASAVAAALAMPPSPGALSTTNNGTAKSWKDVEADDPTKYEWHNSELAIEDRMKLAEGKPLELRMMAAMAQLNCGQCGYLCRTYSKAIETGEEKDLKKCTPGGKATSRMLVALNAEPRESANAGNLLDGVTPAAMPSIVDAMMKPAWNGNGNGNQANNGHQTNSSGLAYSRQNPFPAHALDVQKLTLDGSAKDVRLISLSLSGSGLSYKVGDALGVFPKNSKEQVEALLRLFKLDGYIPVRTPDGTSTTLRGALSDHCDIKNVSDEFYDCLKAKLSVAEAKWIDAIQSDQDVEGLASNPRLIDVVARFHPTGFTPEEVVETLDTLKPRLYSIASSPLVDPNRVDLVVGVVQYSSNGQIHKGVASNFLAERMIAHEPVPVFIQPCHHFGLPSDPATPVIMVGPGTGVAPFRAFLHERRVTKASGENWLFFGDQHEKTDFLLREEIMQLQADGYLHRLSTAFSRDTEKRVYVQQRMLEHRDELWNWIDKRGAHFYVCGDASKMAGDVDRALHEIAKSCGNLSEDTASYYIKQLKTTNRYQRDVY